MKEQKYKFWNTEKNEMYGPYTLEAIMLGPVIINLLLCLSNGTCKVLQYTGRNDIKRAEIYHKDILRITEEDEEPGEGIVRWTAIGWSINGSWLSDLNKHAEVIRSSYEPRKGKKC